MPKSIIGILSILIVIATYLVLLAMMGAKAGGESVGYILKLN